MGKKRLARQKTPGIAAFSFCMLQAAGKLRLRRVPFCLGARSSDEANPSEGGKWHARPARPESSEGLAFSEARGAICASAAVDIRGVQGVHGPGPEAKRAASAQSEFAPLAGSFAPRRARTSLGNWARTSLSSLNWKVSFWAHRAKLGLAVWARVMHFV